MIGFVHFQEKIELCYICEQKIVDYKSQLHLTGSQTIVGISNNIGDRLAEKLENTSLPIPVHLKCRQCYTSPSMVDGNKRKGPDLTDDLIVRLWYGQKMAHTAMFVMITLHM